MLINYFLILTTLLLISGLALDAGMLEWRRVHLQTAADAAAQEGMYQYARSDGSWSAEAKVQAANNGFTDGANGVTVTLSQPPTSTVWVGDSWSVQANVSQSVNNIFMGLVNGGKSTISATAVARKLPTCVWIMDANNTTANSTFQLASARLTGQCGLYVNTATGPNLGVDYFATLANLRSRVVGPAVSNSSTGTLTPQPRFGATVKNDPLAYVTSPKFTACTYSNVSLSGGSFTITPGTYCGGVTLNGVSLTLTSGLYIITGGVTMTNSSLDGTAGVTIFFTQGGGAGYGSVSISQGSGTSSLRLKAPTTSSGGGVPGICMFADRNWITHGARGTGSGVSMVSTQVTMDGVIYLPNTGLYLWSSPITYYTYNGLVVDNLYDFGSTSTFHTDYSPLGSVSPYHYEDGALVE
jgi:hypothetical protein